MRTHDKDNSISIRTPHIHAHTHTRAQAGKQDTIADMCLHTRTCCHGRPRRSEITRTRTRTSHRRKNHMRVHTATLERIHSHKHTCIPTRTQPATRVRNFSKNTPSLHSHTLADALTKTITHTHTFRPFLPYENTLWCVW